MPPTWVAPLAGLAISVLVAIPILVIGGVRWGGGRALLRRVRARRPGCVAFVVDPIPTPQTDLDRLTGARTLERRMVLSAEATGLELWYPDVDEPIMTLAWSSVESTGMGSYITRTEPIWDRASSYSGTTIAFNLAGGGSIHFQAPGSRLPLDVLADLASTREVPGRRAIQGE